MTAEVARSPAGSPPAASGSDAVRVAVDARALADASAYRGIGTYVRNLVSALEGVPEVEVTALLPHRRVAPPRWATVEHHLRLPRELARTPADVNHSPALDPPRRSTRPWVQTVPDVVALIDEDPALAVERRRWRRWAPRVRRADAVITFSRHSADQAVSALGLDAGRVHVVPLAAGPEFRPAPATAPPGGPLPASATDPAADAPGAAPRPYVLYVGEYGAHKGFAEAAGVIARLAAAGLPHDLWMAGRVTDQSRPLVEEALRAGAGAEGRTRVRVLGWVPDLVSLYHGAAALIVTSRHEGFGLPAVEAMACGTPVVAFANSATAEVVGAGGVLVPDGDVGAMAEQTASVLRSAARRAELAAAGLERSRSFSWTATAQAHAAIYRSIACA